MKITLHILKIYIRRNKMINPDSHFILYAKNHYQRFNHILDMQIIIAHECGFPDIEMVDYSHIVNRLNRIVFPYLKNSEDKFSSFISQCIWISYWDGLNEMERFIQACIHIMSDLTVKWERNPDGQIELDEPDFTILPKRGE
jgi:hypothetical protein